jgi:hypothetical protein
MHLDLDAIRKSAPCDTIEYRVIHETALHGFQALPLTSRGEAFGVLALYAEEADAFSETTVGQYADLANNLATQGVEPASLSACKSP